MDPIYNAYILLFYLAENNIDLKLAHKEIDIALKHNPNNPYFFDTKGYIYKKQGESDKALSYVRKAHILAPKDSAISKRHMFYNTMNSF